MGARTLLYTAMAIAPVVLTVGIGYHSRTYEDAFEWPNAKGDHSRINAYIGLVRETLPSVGPNRFDNEPQVREIAMAWIEGARTGKLQPLTPVTAEELYLSNQKGRILDANILLSRKLQTYADIHIANGKYREAATSLVLGSDIMQAPKYSNFVSLMRLSLLQSAILHRFETVYPKLGQKDRIQVAACMDRMKIDRRSFDLIAARTNKVILDEIARHQDTDEALQQGSATVPEDSFYEQPALAKARPGNEDQSYAGGEFAISNEAMEANQCQNIDQRNRSKIAEILNLKSK